jgi:hypothetical protein
MQIHLYNKNKIIGREKFPPGKVNKMTILAKEINAKLLGRKIIKVKTNKDEEVEFEIQRVNVETFAGKSGLTMENVLKEKEAEIEKMFLDKIKSQEISEIMAPVLLDGVVSPKIVNKEILDCNLEKEVPFKVLLTDMILATELYIQICSLSVDKK